MIKDLMVHLDGTKEDEIRLAHAEVLSNILQDARITGLYTNLLPEYAYVLAAQSGYGGMEAIVALENEIRERGDQAIEKITRRVIRPDSSNEVHRIDAWPSQVAECTVSLARCSDLFVATAPYRYPMEIDWKDVIEAVLFEAGRCVYLIPPGCPARREIRSALLAWNDTAQAARVVSEAIPLLRHVTLVRLLTVEAPTDRRRGEEAVDIAAHLDRHGVKVEIVSIPGEARDTAKIIEEQASKMAADVIVMGAYGHSRFREWILGGATRELIERSQLPLFLAH